MKNVLFLKFFRVLLGKSKLYHTFRFRRIRKFIPSVAQKYHCDVTENIVSQMEEAFIEYHWGLDEFFMYDYIHLTNEERESFVPDYEKNVFCDKANNWKDEKVFHDKWNTYLKFKEFYKRKVIHITKIEDLYNEEIKSLKNSASKYIIKPTVSTLGQGVKIISSEDLKNIQINKGDSFIVEELIHQSPDMAKFHPQSVNTVRIPTMRCGNSVEIIHPFMKIGRGKQVVDNAGSGGIICEIDKNTGIILAACDELLNKFDSQPETSEKIKGFQIPKWNEAVQLAIKLSNKMPTVRYVGWDLALTDEGWVLVEGNEKGQFVWQIISQKGFRQEFNDICCKANINI